MEALSIPNTALVMLVVCLTAAICLAIAKTRTRQMRLAIRAALSANQDLLRQLEHDPLTMCYSRQYFVTRATEILGTPNGRGLTLMIVDIDYFKTINDSYGHAAGDAYLIAAAKALKNHLGKDTIVARLGGDEFWIARDAMPAPEAQALAGKLVEVMGKVTTKHHGTKITRTASIGVTLARPSMALDEAMQEADTALYLAKSSGRNSSVHAGRLLRETLNTKRTQPTIEGIREGLADQQFTYFVQPIFDITANQPAQALGVEALIRWVRPDGSILLPADFMATITRHYGDSVRPPLQLANQVASRFAAADPPMFCAFNVSSAFLQRSIGNGKDWTEKLLDGLDPKCTVFEIVESAVIEDAAKAKSLLIALRNAGVRIALDDFGTGHSNLMRLRDLPVDIVKIDRGFIASISNSQKNTAILKALIGMGRDLGFEIIAEGVETQDQLFKLQDLGITQAQGFYLGAPASVEEWSERLAPRSSPKSNISAAQ